MTNTTEVSHIKKQRKKKAAQNLEILKSHTPLHKAKLKYTDLRESTITLLQVYIVLLVVSRKITL